MVRTASDWYPLDSIKQMSRRSGGSRRSAADSQASTVGSEYFENGAPPNFQEMLENMNDVERDTGERLRRHMQFFFMNPKEKWTVRKQFPYKLALQILKIVFVTLQLVLFAEMRMSHVDFMEDTNTVMRHKFLKDWNDDRDAIQYPPAEGRYSVYNGNGIFEHVQFIVDSYYDIQTEPFASFSYDMQRSKHDPFLWSHNVSLTAGVVFDKIPPIDLCVDRIASVVVNNNTYEFDITDVHGCMPLNFTQDEVDQIRQNATEVVTALKKRNVTFSSEDALLISKATLNFNLRTIHFSPQGGDQKPECYRIAVSIVFDNSHHTGQIHVTLATVINYENVCNGRVIKGSGWGWDTWTVAINDLLVLLLCISSFILCLRALIKAHLLKNKAIDYFENTLRMKMSVSDQLDFLNLWYVMIVINDVCIIIGTLSKVTIEFRDFDNSLFTLTGILLGLGALLVYVGLLRYFGFFNQYNILILTMKKSIPNMLRFMTCAVVLYFGFLIAGWVIIGPYSIKVFGTIYIYCFVSLFIYVVLSLFIAIIMDAYEVVKDRYTEGLHIERSMLKDFVDTAPAPTELSSPTAQADFAPDALLNLGAGNDSRSVRALRAIDRLRDWIQDLRHDTRFQSFSNPLHDRVSAPSVNSGSNNNAGSHIL